jgi:hypothetical protein
MRLRPADPAQKAASLRGRMPWPALFRSFRAQLLALILVIVIPAVAIAFHGNLEHRRSEKARLRERALAISELAAAKEQDFVDDTRQLLSTLTQFPALLRSTNESFSRNHLSNLRKLSPDYANFGLIETNGILFCSADPVSAEVDLRDRMYFQKTLESQQFSAGDFQVGRITGIPAFTFGYPVLNDQNHLARVLYASLKLSPMVSAIADLQAPSGGAISLLDREGTVLARNPDSSVWIGKSLANYLPVRQILSGTGGVFEAQMTNQVSKLYAVTVISDGQSPCMYVVVEAPLAILYARANAALFRNFSIMTAIALITWLLVHLSAWHFFFQPMKRLSTSANRLAEG